MPAKFEKIVDAVKQSLRKAHPNWSEERISSDAFGTATNVWKKSHGGKPPE